MAGSTGTLMLADKRQTWFLLADAPVDPAALTVDDFTGAINCGAHLFANDTYLGPTGSESVNEPLLNGDPNAAFGRDNYDGRAAVTRFFDDNGIPDETGDTLFSAMKEKGTPLWFATRNGPEWDVAAAKEQEVSLFKVKTDTPQTPQQETGYIKNIVPLAVQAAWMNQAIGAGA